QRFIIMVAGAVMNVVLAYVLALIINGVLGEPVGTSAQLSGVNVGAPAYEAGMRGGDRILEIDGMEVTDGTTLSEATQEAGAHEVLVVFERDGEVHEVYLTPVEQQGRYFLGVDIMIYRERSIMGTIRSANAQVIEFSTLIFDTLRMLGTGEAGAGDLAGFVGIAYMTGQVAAQGFLALLSFAALININLAIFNLLPFPALDGGHITFIVIEAIIGKPVNSKIQNGVTIVGLVLLMGLMAFTVFNDVFRFILN
ncbi:MAG: RIP metalloprotease RseP, partial [Turicibacter sp.]|nr:RIP metalloprotease RseP [Turicibacter sp.]